MITTKPITVRNRTINIEIDELLTDVNVLNGHLVTLTFAQGKQYFECAKSAIRIAKITNCNVSYMFSNVWIAFSPSAYANEANEINDKYEYFKRISRPLESVLTDIRYYENEAFDNSWEDNPYEQEKIVKDMKDAIVELRKYRKGITVKSLDAQIDNLYRITKLKDSSYDDNGVESFVVANDVCNMIERLIENGHGSPQSVIKQYFETALVIAKTLNDRADIDDVLDYLSENWRYGELVRS